MDRAVTVAFLSMALAIAGCGADRTSAPSIPAGASLEITVHNLGPLPPGVGRFDMWVRDRNGQAYYLGPLAPDGGVVLRTSPIHEPVAIEVTFEPLSDSDGVPSQHVVLKGRFVAGRAGLSVRGALTAGDLPLRERPGQFTMFTPSDNAVNGYPSHEESGVWLFNMAPRETPQNDTWVRLTQLTPGWVYEGWMVRDMGKPGEIWLSYGKFRPDASGAVNSRDDTGWGPFSGVLDFLTAGEEEFPGDDWISNPLGLPLPPGVVLPLDLRERDSEGRFRWTHVITVEPSSDIGEPLTQERPFVIRPYRDPFGDGGPGVPRTITYRLDAVPYGQVIWLR
ncbi:MAG TPA: hypothetical protein VNL96_09960 [Gemmatimonadaceae bacterium]|nr:hypothetical protein [Gemmatimonadaceae bacterium]